MKKKNIKKTIILTLGIISIFSITALASSGSAYIKNQSLYYYNTPSSGRGNAVTEWSSSRNSVYLGAKLESVHKQSNGDLAYTYEGFTIDSVAAGVTASKSVYGWSSTHSVFEGGVNIFEDTLWANGK